MGACPTEIRTLRLEEKKVVLSISWRSSGLTKGSVLEIVPYTVQGCMQKFCKGGGGEGRGGGGTNLGYFKKRGRAQLQKWNVKKLVW